MRVLAQQFDVEYNPIPSPGFEAIKQTKAAPSKSAGLRI
jgi:hypothetical protein